jgi:hypothetical protein
VAVQKDQRTKRLMRRRGAHLPLHCQRREKPRALVLAHLQGMALPMEQDQPLDPTDICLLRPHTIMSQPDRPGPGRVTEACALRECESSRQRDGVADHGRGTPVINTRPHWKTSWTNMTPVSARSNPSVVHRRASYDRSLPGVPLRSVPQLPPQQV